MHRRSTAIVYVLVAIGALLIAGCIADTFGADSSETRTVPVRVGTPLDAPGAIVSRAADHVSPRGVTGELRSDVVVQDPNAVDLIDLAQPSGLLCCGTDDRVQINNPEVFPWRTMPYLEIYNEDLVLVSICSGTFIGPDAVMTAAHCIYNPAFGGFAGAIRVVPGKNGTSEPYGSVFAESFFVPTQWINTGSIDSDWGVLNFA